VERVLVICMGGIGNMVMLTPALKMLAGRWPEASFSFLLRQCGSRDVVEKHPQLGGIVETCNSVRETAASIAAVKAMRPDLVFSTTGTNPLKCGLVGLVSGARWRLGESFLSGRLLYNVRVPFDKDKHEVAANADIARAVVPDAGSGACTVWTDFADTEAARARMSSFGSAGGVVGMHLGSGPEMAYKRWPVERFVQVAQAMVKRCGAQVVIFGGPAERDIARSAARDAGESVMSVAGELSIRQSYEAMKLCRLFISNDSGPMHLAAAAGCPVVALFGPTFPARTGPWGEEHVVVSDTDGCSACYRYKPVRCTHRDCMMRISVERVIAVAAAQWEECKPRGKENDVPG
jgi:ADP-heptose:LPS heptosyltransferase